MCVPLISPSFRYVSTGTLIDRDEWQETGWVAKVSVLGVFQTVAIVVFSALAFSFYVFFAPFLGTRALKFIIIGVFTPLVSTQLERNAPLTSRSS